MDRLRNLFGRHDSEAEDKAAQAEVVAADVAEPAVMAEVTEVAEVAAAAVAEAEPTPRMDATRQLPDLENALLNPSQHVTVGYSRDLGKVRENNEDSLYTFFTSLKSVTEVPEFGIFLVADGAGGYEGGEIASSTVTAVMADELMRRIYRPIMAQSFAFFEDAEPMPPVGEILSEAALLADQKIREEVPGAATTLTAIVMIGNLAHIVHVGDSRAYLIARGFERDEHGIERLTRDHSLKERLVEIGQITREEADEMEGGEELWKIMGLTDNLDPDTNTRRLPSHSYIVICSDGLWKKVKEPELLATVLNLESPQAACDRLVAMANANGGEDNISVIVVKVPEN